MNKIPTLAILLVVVGLGSLVVGIAYSAYNVRPSYSNGSWQGQNQGMMGGAMVNVPMSSIDNATFNSINVPPRGVTVDKAANSISISTTGATILIEAAPLWYPRSGDYWLSYGLVNPTILVKQGAEVHFLFINMDNDTHVPAITNMHPPYPYMPMMSVMMNGNYQFQMGPMLPGIATYTSGVNPVYSDTTVSVSFSTTGTYWYPCLYTDHAQMGMYGEIQVVN